MYKSNFLAINLRVKIQVKVYYTYIYMYIYTIYTMGRPIKSYNLIIQISILFLIPGSQ